MTGLVGPKGQPISSKDFQNKRTPAPELGERYGQWAGEEVRFMSLPGGGALAMDLSRLTLSDYRQMKDHYQINSSLSVLTFMMHQMDWHVECEDKRIQEFTEANLRMIWSRLVRGMSQALWAGYSPNVLQWENDVDGRRIVLNKVKDLIPEDCKVHWNEVSDAPTVNGAQPRKHKVYDGIDQFGFGKIPVDNTFWYPLLMENGNYYGKQLLRSAFQPWFFSMLMHLFANRYYERFGEPVPVGRAPYEDEINVNGQNMRGNELMEGVLNQIRNRSVVVLPNERTAMGQEQAPPFDYQIEYLESQMRGADFERYMTRLDEEISLSMFTPILMMRTADVGSYNLGTQHTQVYKWMLNAFGGDWTFYIDRYILRPLKNYNFGPNAPEAKIKFAQMGKVSSELLQAIITQLMSKNKIKFDTREIGEMAGLSVEEIEAVVGDETADPAPDESGDGGSGQPNTPNPNPDPKEGRAVLKLITDRVEKQVVKAFRTNGDLKISMGYKRQMVAAFKASNLSEPENRADQFYHFMQSWLQAICGYGTEEFTDSAQFMRVFTTALESQMERALS